MTDIHDTESPLPGTGAPPAAEPGGVEDLLEELIEIITSAKSMPLSSSAIVTRDEVLDLLEAIRDELPEELRRARRLLKDHEELLAAAKREAADIVSDGRVQSERMVQRTEIVRQAEHRAVRIIEDAEAEARRDAPRGRGLRRPEAGRLRDSARPDVEDRQGRPRTACFGAAAASPNPVTRRWASSAMMPGSPVRGSSTRIWSEESRPSRTLRSRRCCAAQAPGTRRRVKVFSPIDELDVLNSRVEPGSGVDLDVVLESVLGGVVVTGTVRGVLARRVQPVPRARQRSPRGSGS